MQGMGKEQQVSQEQTSPPGAGEGSRLLCQCNGEIQKGLNLEALSQSVISILNREWFNLLM